MASKFLSGLTPEEYKQLTARLHQRQNGKCFICGDAIELGVSKTDVDHIIPLANKGKDDENNFALTHSSCNRAKQDADLNVARVLAKLRKLQEEVDKKEHKAASLKNLLVAEGGSKFKFKFKEDGDELVYSFDDIGDVKIRRTPIFVDERSKERTAFVEVPLEYLYHDDLINPRGINSSINLLVKEFYKNNPQLHLTLARLDDGMIKVFDGQHKAVAQILLGVKRICVRLFISPDVNRLIEANSNAGSKLRQIAFDKSVMRQLNDVIYKERVEKYRQDHSLSADNMDFSEMELCQYFKGDNMKKYIIEALKRSITDSPDNRLRAYIDFEGKGKSLPISHSTYDKVFLSQFIDSKLILKKPLDDKADEGLNPRELEVSQISQLLSIIADKIFVGKFNLEVGVHRIENKIIGKKDGDITDEHLVAYRMSKEEISHEWVPYLLKVIKGYFLNNGINYSENSLFQTKFSGQLWVNLEKFIAGLAALPMWKDRTMANSHFSGKKNYDFWKHVFETGQTPDGVEVMPGKLEYNRMLA